MTRKSILIIALFFVQMIGFGQHYKLDSLKQLIAKIHKLPVDTSQTRKLRNLGYDCIDIDSSFSKKIIVEALTKSISIKNDASIADCYRILGLWYKNFNYKDKAFECYKSSLKAAKKGNNLYRMSGAYFNMGNIKYWEGEYDNCIDYFLKTQKIFDNPKIFDDKTLTIKVLDKRRSDLYYNMSSVFCTLKNLPKADEYINKALAIANKYKNKTVIAFYTEQKADNYYESGNIEKSLRTRLKFLKELENGTIPKTYIQGYYYSISNQYFELHKVDSSKYFAQKSLRLSNEIKIADGIANSNLQLGKIAMQEKQFAKAENYFDTCKAYYLKSKDPEEKRSYFEIIHQFMFETNRYKDAYQNFKKYSDLNDTIQNSERAMQFLEREARFQSEKKDQQIVIQNEQLEKRQNSIIFLIISLIGVCIIGFLYYRNFTAKKRIVEQKIKQLQQEKKIDAAQNIIQGEETERTRLARDLHDGLGGMLTGVKFQLNSMKGNVILSEENAETFTRSILQLDSAITEMRRVAHNMMPESLLKFGLNETLKNYCESVSQNSGIVVSFQSLGMKKQLEQTFEIALYRIIQELLNNTVKHAKAAQAQVQLSRIENRITLTVEDNGKGFDVNSSSRNGIGLSNIQNRVNYLNGKMDVKSDEKGTSTHIEFEIT
jgi:signal transduction histidine kinase